ncbi:hypothetical protein FOS14_10860 [Skermania sp. ID1734]|uniref:DUF6230 family protein n=1 Tax=Skermania sp. ID1734 TaxID=2597516 RepID=UPI00117EEDA2|nr:DUF6230 family protein [Skermania sp. ID1734]TSD99752.1 hypothetical protein FOS14_10860 [Skermania sp. ID1734]
MTADAVTRGGTRWRRTGLLLLPALLLVLLMTVLLLQGVIPIHLAISGQRFKLSSNGPAKLHGVAAYPSTMKMKDGSHVPIVLAAVPQADLPDGMCLSLVLTFPIIGTNTIQFRTNNRTEANDLSASIDHLQLTDALLNAKTVDKKVPEDIRNSVGQGLVVNKDASSLVGLPSGQPGGFGLQGAGMATTQRLKVNADGAIIAGTVTLNGIAIPKVGHGSGVEHHECF